MTIDAINWSNVRHIIGDMHDDEELRPVKALAAGRRKYAATAMVKVDGEWVLLLSPMSKETR